jgi:hypothetical protein
MGEIITYDLPKTDIQHDVANIFYVIKGKRIDGNTGVTWEFEFKHTSIEDAETNYANLMTQYPDDMIMQMRRVEDVCIREYR